MSNPERISQIPVLQPDYPSDEIDLRKLLATIWTGKWLILVLAVAFGAAGFGYAKFQPNIYTANAVLAPKDGALVRGGGGLRGLASLAGMNVGGDNGNKSILAQEVLKSRIFLGDFIVRHGYGPQLVAAERWDRSARVTQYNSELYDSQTSEWRIGEGGGSLAPSIVKLVQRLKAGLTITTSRDSGMLQLSYEHLSPAFAKEVVDNLILDLNQHMRKLDIEASENRIAYLQQKIQETGIAGMQQVFFQLIEEETRNLMMANASSDYVFTVIDPAVEPEVKSAPKRLLIVLVALMAGGLIGVILVIFRSLNLPQITEEKN